VLCSAGRQAIRCAPPKDASVTTFSKMIFGCLIGFATSSAAYAQDISTVAQVSVGTAAITAGVVLLHGDDSAPSTSSTEGVNSFTGSDIGRGSETSSASFAGYGDNAGVGATSGNGPLAPGGAAGIQTASNSSSDDSIFAVFGSGSQLAPIITFLTCATSTLATSSGSTSSTGTSP
jgi:hypothetical protein